MGREAREAHEYAERIRERVERTLRELRMAKGWSVYELEKRCGISREMIGRVERGDSAPFLPCGGADRLRRRGEAVMRIEQTGSPFDPATSKAEITSASSPSARMVVAAFRKARGKIAGVRFSGRKVGTTTLLPLGDVRTVSPPTLEFPIAPQGVAEDWQIQAQAILKDQPVGIPSNFVPVLVCE